jgi:hypothetical protein
MPKRLVILDGTTGENLERWAVDGREMIARDPGRYSLVHEQTELTAGGTPDAEWDLAGSYAIKSANRAQPNSA